MTSLPPLHNTYFALRHGESIPNVLQIIISDPKNGLDPQYGLTPKGRQQTQKTIQEAQQQGTLNEKTLIFSSDFSRGMQTAAIAQELLQCPPVIPEIRLRERFFGDFEKTPNANYMQVWEMDNQGPDVSQNGVETANAVLSRVISLVLDCEKQYTNKIIVFVSHGDTLQILQTAFEGIIPSEHRLLPHLEKGELRLLQKKH